MWRKPPWKQCFRAIIFFTHRCATCKCQLSDLMKTNMQTIPRDPKPVWWDIWSGNYMEMRLRTPVTRGYFFLLGALRLVNAASPRTISVHKKKISSGTQGNARHDFWANWKTPSICRPFLPEEQVSNPIQKSSCTPSRSEKQWPVRRYRCCEAQRWSYIEVTLEFGLHLLEWVFCYRLIRCLDSRSRWHLLAHPTQSRYALLRNKNQENQNSRKTTVGWFGSQFNEEDSNAAFSLFTQLSVVY